MVSPAHGCNCVYVLILSIVLIAILIEAYTEVVKPDDDVPFNSVGEQLTMAFQMAMMYRHRRGALEKKLQDAHLLEILRSFARDGVYSVSEEDIAARLDPHMRPQLAEKMPILKRVVGSSSSAHNLPLLKKSTRLLQENARLKDRLLLMSDLFESDSGLTTHQQFK